MYVLTKQFIVFKMKQWKVHLKKQKDLFLIKWNKRLKIIALLHVSIMILKFKLNITIDNESNEI